MYPTARRLTLVDGMTLIAATAIGCWESRYGLVPVLYALTGGFDATNWAAHPAYLAWNWGSVILRHTQPTAAIITLAVLALRFLPPRPGLRRLARQPGFAACAAASLATFIGGILNIATNTAVFSPTVVVQKYAETALLPRGSEPGLAVAACWLLLKLNGSWRSEGSWIDRFGRLIGVYWLMMAVITRFAH
jgi:hypothetical protein